MALDGVTSFLRLKDVTNACKRMRRGLSIGGSSFSAKTESWKKLKASNLFSSFIVNLNKNRSAPVRDLLRSRQLRYDY